MQNMYVGDIGDYGKYGLLRALAPAYQKLGVVWYLVGNEYHLNDGRHIDYLEKLKFMDCDEELFVKLKQIIASNNRNLEQIQEDEILPDNTVYYDEQLSYDGVKANSPMGRAERLRVREKWIGNAIEEVSGCDAVFLDPDNGLETPSVDKHKSKAPKYVFYNEVERFLSNTETVIIYHHLSRTGNHLSQISNRAQILKEISGDSNDVISLRFKPYSPRAYFIITCESAVKQKVKEFLSSKWKDCFQLISDVEVI